MLTFSYSVLPMGGLASQRHLALGGIGKLPYISLMIEYFEWLTQFKTKIYTQQADSSCLNHSNLGYELISVGGAASHIEGSSWMIQAFECHLRG
jgi:hypothetical protein